MSKATEIKRLPLPYHENCTHYFTAIRHLGKPIVLDSGGNERGRYDILSANPVATIAISESESLENYADIFKQIRNLQNHFPDLHADDLPFSGGLLGYLGYNLAHAKYHLAPYVDSKQKSAAIEDDGKTNLPTIYFGAYGWAVIQDHEQKTTELIAHPALEQDHFNEIKRLLVGLQPRVKTTQSTSPLSFALSSPITSNLDKTEYKQLFKHVQDYIRAGDCYQINLARQFSADFIGDPWQAYCQLRAIGKAPYSAYIELNNDTDKPQAILSFSPERFLKLNKNVVITEPIKGTAARDPDAVRDKLLAAKLLSSEKNRAENLMIVDLLRNDLGQVCEPGSIAVEKLFELQSFNTVHHLVSRISGKLKPEEDAVSLLAACFPGGSITGAPKKRATEIIRQLEPNARSVFCGAIVMLSSNGKMDSNIAIRSMICEKGKLKCWAGGGLVADSVAEDEFTETWDKVGKLLLALPTSVQK